MKKRIWRLRTQSLDLSRSPLWMGVLNATPDSFSDGGLLGVSDGVDFRVDWDAAEEKARRLVRDGADILDIGGESTRPGSEPVSAEEQIARTVPLIRRLAQSLSVPISIDTANAQAAREALRAGAEIVNDISGLTFDPEMAETVAEFGAGVCLGHIQGTPKTMQDAPVYANLIGEVSDFLLDKADRLVRAGLDPSKIIFDPGLGFGKTPSDNLTLLNRLDEWDSLGFPLLIGHSRKRFLNSLDVSLLPPSFLRPDENLAETDFSSWDAFLAELRLIPSDKPDPLEAFRKTLAGRDRRTSAVSVFLASRNVGVLRVHNVRMNREAVDLWRKACRQEN